MSASIKRVVGCSLLLVLACTARADEDVDPVLAKAQLAKAVADAQKAEYDAESAAAKAKFGTLADYSATGSVTAGANAGKLEASLLGAEATLAGGAEIAQRVCAILEPMGAAWDVVVVSESEKMSFDAYDAFRIQATLIREQMDAALARQPGPAHASSERTIATAGMGTTLALAGNLLRSDYAVSDVSLTADDALLARAVVNQAPCRSATHPFSLPSQYIMPIDPVSNAAMAQLHGLDMLRQQLEDKQAMHSEASTKGKEAAKAEKDKVRAAKLLADAERYDLLVVATTAALKRYDDFRTKIGSPDDKGVMPLSLIARQAYLAAKLDNGYMLVLKANMLGGAAYTEKNFWTFLGTMPFSVAGGATSSFSLIDGRTGNVMGSGVVAYSAPYAKVHRTIKRYRNGIPQRASINRSVDHQD